MSVLDWDIDADFSFAIRGQRPGLEPDGERPAVIEVDGGYVHIAVHDQAFRSQRSMWRERLRTSHPDHGGTAAGFIAVRRRYEAWLKAERKYYAHYGLDLPGVVARRPATASPLELLAAPQTGTVQVMRFLSGREGWTSYEQIMEALGLTRLRVQRLLNQIRAKGTEVESMRDGYTTLVRVGPDRRRKNVQERLIAILQDGQFHAVSELEAVMPKTSVLQAVLRLRRCGIPVMHMRFADGRRGYQLMDVGGGGDNGTPTS